MLWFFVEVILRMAATNLSVLSCKASAELLYLLRERSSSMLDYCPVLMNELLSIAPKVWRTRA